MIDPGYRAELAARYRERYLAYPVGTHMTLVGLYGRKEALLITNLIEEAEGVRLVGQNLECNSALDYAPDMA